jgi:hypothetical protein
MPTTAQAEDRIRAALGCARQKLLNAQQKAQACVNVVRAQIAARK